MELTSENVQSIFEDCLFRGGEDMSNAILVKGIISDFGFHPGRIDNNKIAIKFMLDQLSDDFKASGGGGMTFLNMCNDRDGGQWTGFHSVMERLVVLGIAINKVRFALPRDLWAVLPGGMPYIVILE